MAAGPEAFTHDPARAKKRAEPMPEPIGEARISLDGWAVGKWYGFLRSAVAQPLVGDAFMNMGAFESPDDDLEQAQRRLGEKAIDAFSLAEHPRLLDLGTGTGELALRAGRRAFEVVGVTVSAREVEHARARARQEGLEARVHFHRADGQALPFADRVFDGAWAIESLVTMERKERAIEELARVVAPGGRLVIVEPVLGPRSRKLEELSIHGALQAVMDMRLSPRERYTDALERGGFRLLEVEDLTPSLRASADKWIERAERWASSGGATPLRRAWERIIRELADPCRRADFVRFVADRR